MGHRLLNLDLKLPAAGRVFAFHPQIAGSGAGAGPDHGSLAAVGAEDRGPVSAVSSCGSLHLRRVEADACKCRPLRQRDLPCFIHWMRSVSLPAAAAAQ